LTNYRVFLSKSAVSVLNSFEEKIKSRIKSVLKELERDPFQSSLDIKKIISNKEPPVFRIRIGDYRATYSIIGKKIMVSKIFHRKKGYKWLD
jgi:mRNA-degrading endonuclease RelE of RelBE toxin-antitoxin system